MFDHDDKAPKWKELVEKMRSIKNEEELEKWLESLDVPHHVDKSKIAAEIRKFFRHETFENFKGTLNIVIIQKLNTQR